MLERPQRRAGGIDAEMNLASLDAPDRLPWNPHRVQGGWAQAAAPADRGCAEARMQPSRDDCATELERVEPGGPVGAQLQEDAVHLAGRTLLAV